MLRRVCFAMLVLVFTACGTPARQAAQVLVWEAYWTGVLDGAGEEEEGDSHLRSTKVLNGLHIHCADGMFGHVELVRDQNDCAAFVFVQILKSAEHDLPCF